MSDQAHFNVDRVLLEFLTSRSAWEMGKPRAVSQTCEMSDPRKGKTRTVVGKSLPPRFLDRVAPSGPVELPQFFITPLSRPLLHLVAQAQCLVQLLYVHFLCLLGFLMLFFLGLQPSLQITTRQGKNLALFLLPQGLSHMTCPLSPRMNSTHISCCRVLMASSLDSCRREHRL